MNAKTIWLLMLQAIGLIASLLLQRHGQTQTAFWLLFTTLIITGFWVAVDAALGTRMLRWMQKGEYDKPLSCMPQSWQDFGDVTLTIKRKHMRKTAMVQERLKAFLDAIQTLPIGVTLLDANGHIEWFNFIAAEHFGFNNPRDLGQQIIHLVRDPQFVNYWLRDKTEHGTTMHGRSHTAHHPVKISVQAFTFGDDKQLLLSRDVTLQEQTDRMRRDFVSNVSHEIRTPLTVLAGFVETLQGLPLEEAERQRYLGLMAEQAQRMQLLVNDLLTLSRLEGSPPPDGNERVNVINLLHQCLHDALSLSRVLGQDHDHTTPNHHITLESNIDSQLHLTGSRSELHSAIGNLLSNAVRYTPAGGLITLHAAYTENGGLRIAVSDTGPGIAREHLSRITERFYRIDKSRSRETGGTGLGLAIVKHIAQRHHATLEIDSTIGRGSCFALAFTAQRLSSAATHEAQTPLAHTDTP